MVAANCQAIKTLELKEEVGSLKRQLANAQNDIQRLKASEEVHLFYGRS